MRLNLLLLVFTLALGAQASAADVRKAADDDQLLENAGVVLRDAQFRVPCRAAVVDTEDPPEFFNCVYVQNLNELNLFSLEDGYLMSELQLRLSNILNVALQQEGSYRQLQIFYGKGRVVAVEVLGARKLHDSPAKTQAIYEWLAGHGIATRSPLPWITAQKNCPLCGDIR